MIKMMKRYLLILRPKKDHVEQDLQVKKFREIFENTARFNIELVEILHFSKDDYYMVHIGGEDDDITRFIWFLMSEVPAYSHNKIELFEMLGSPSCLKFTLFTVFDNRARKRVFKREGNHSDIIKD